jgi:hypothetical protein
MKIFISIITILLFISGCNLSQGKFGESQSNMEGSENGEGDGDFDDSSEHGNITTNCRQCHSNTRRPNTVKHSMPNTDCSLCHTSASVGSGLSWKNISTANHPGVTANCKSCHQANMPTNIAPHLSGQIGATLNCSSCHSYPNWSTPHFNHSSSLKTCTECHDTGKVSTIIQQRPLNHPAVNHSNLECALCHVNSNNATSWTQTVIFNHHSHLPTPQNCQLCHF